MDCTDALKSSTVQNPVPGMGISGCLVDQGRDDQSFMVFSPGEAIQDLGDGVTPAWLP